MKSLRSPQANTVHALSTPMFSTKKTGKRGACLQCARRKRKCDHKQPRCSQCVRLGVQCETQTFKLWTTSTVHSALNRPRKSNATAASPSQTVDSQTSQATEQDSHTNTELLLEPAPQVRQQDNVAAQWSTSSGDEMDVLFDPTNESSFLASLDQLWDPGVVGDCGPKDVSTLPMSRPCELPHEDMTDLFGSFEDQTIDRLSPETRLPIIQSKTPRRMSSLPAPEVPGFHATSHILFDSPPNLHCPVPWPPDMKSSSESRFLWHYFLSVTENGFLCFDINDMKGGDLQDPYIAVLPQRALDNATLRKAVLCFSAFQYKALGRDDKYSSALSKFSREASVSFVREATKPIPDERDIFSTIAAGVFLHHFSLDRRIPYLHLSTWLTSKLLSRRPKSLDMRRISHEEILTLLRWTVISSACSLNLSQTHLTLENFRMIQMRQEEVGLNLSSHYSLFREWVNHPLYAFSSRLINPLLRIGKLLQQSLLMETGRGMPDEHAAKFQEEVQEVEEELAQARRNDLLLLGSLEPTDPDPLLCVNESMHAAASILLHARLKKLPATAPIIRSNVDLVVNQLSEIGEDSRALFAVVFPLFSAGCEAVDTHARQMIQVMLQVPRGLAYDRGDLVAALQHIWQIRDLNPGLPWPYWRDKVDHRYRIDRLM